MEIHWTASFLVVVFSACSGHVHKNLQRLSCLNDYVNNVSCVWNSSMPGPRDDCRIIGTGTFWKLNGHKPHLEYIRQYCNLKWVDGGKSLRSCSFVFANKSFSSHERLPDITVECAGVPVENITNYKPVDHIKMHPPKAPKVNSTVNETIISWNLTTPQPAFITQFQFQVQIKDQKHKHWRVYEVPNLGQKLTLRAGLLIPGYHYVRVRVKPPDSYINAQWSDWGPITSCLIERDTPDLPEHSDPSMTLTSWLVMAGISLIMFVVLLMFFKIWRGRSFLKPVPDPSKYFHTLNSVHGGNFKNWLSSQPGLESFFIVQPGDHISPVKLTDVSDEVSLPACTPTSTTALIHAPANDSSCGQGCSDNHASSSSTSYPSCLSSCSSCFSNMGYFYQRDTIKTSPQPTYFNYQGDLDGPDDSQDIQFPLAAPLVSSVSYECLRHPGHLYQGEPHSPDSGFGIGLEDHADLEQEQRRGEKGGVEVLGNCHCSPLSIFPLQLPPRMSEPSAPAPRASIPEVSQDDQGMGWPGAGPNGGYVSWPMGASGDRQVEVEVAEDPCHGEYMTLKGPYSTMSI